VGNQIDAHYLVQIENLYREQMWLSLDKEFEAMDSHFISVRDESIQLIKALSTIYQ
jgi:hypothetical protein